MAEEAQTAVVTTAGQIVVLVPALTFDAPQKARVQMAADVTVTLSPVDD